MHDNIDDGRQYRLFSVLDDFNRDGQGVAVDLSLPSARVIRALDQIVDWRGLRIHSIQPGKPRPLACDGCMTAFHFFCAAMESGGLPDDCGAFPARCNVISRPVLRLTSSDATLVPDT